MSGKSRSSSGRKSPAAPVPLKADPPAAKPAPRPSSAPAQEAVDSKVESQVEALLDEAQQQVQAMSELVDDSAPQRANSPDAAPPVAAPPAAVPAPAEAATAIESTANAQAAAHDRTPPSEPSLDGPVDAAALQSQVDAILAEAGHGPATDDVEDLSSSAPTGVDDSDMGDAESDDDAADADVPPMDIATVDAVIADAAQRAMEEDEFEAGASAAADASAPPGAAGSSGKESPRRVVKGGDASMRRVKPKAKKAAPSGADLDGGMATPAERSSGSTAQEDLEAPEEATAAADPLDPRWRARASRVALHGMAILNEPWSRWSPPTRYMVLAFTFLNIALAGVAYLIIISRLF